jgi:hypothetical protein
MFSGSISVCFSLSVRYDFTMGNYCISGIGYDMSRFLCGTGKLQNCKNGNSNAILIVIMAKQMP